MSTFKIVYSDRRLVQYICTLTFVGDEVCWVDSVVKSDSELEAAKQGRPGQVVLAPLCKFKRFFHSRAMEVDPPSLEGPIKRWYHLLWLKSNCYSKLAHDDFLQKPKADELMEDTDDYKPPIERLKTPSYTNLSERFRVQVLTGLIWGLT
jgi:hypothetical protein